MISERFPFRLLPLLVVIIKAPLAALVPYKAAAAGPFSNVTDSTSSGFISLPRLPASTWLFRPWSFTLPATFGSPGSMLELSMGIPSTTMSAWLLPVSEVPPRNTIRVELPTPPEELVIWTPATFPCSEFKTLRSFPFVRSALLIVVVA